jgi:hypothetical protein
LKITIWHEILYPLSQTESSYIANLLSIGDDCKAPFGSNILLILFDDFVDLIRCHIGCQQRWAATLLAQKALWKERLALGVFLTALLRDAPYFWFDVWGIWGNLLDGLTGKYSNYSISFIQVITLTLLNI